MSDVCSDVMHCQPVMKTAILVIMSFSLLLHACLVSADTRGWVPPSRSAGTGCRIQHRSRSAFSGVPSYNLPHDWRQEPLLWPLPAIHADGAVWNCCHPGGHSGNNRWVAFLLPNLYPVFRREPFGISKETKKSIFVLAVDRLSSDGKCFVKISILVFFSLF